MSGVRIDDLFKTYGDTTAVDGITLEFSEGTLTTMLGPSGCGKTTTLRCIAGLERPDRGTISIRGEDVFSKDTDVPPEKRRVGIVFQSYAIWPHMTVFDNIAFPLKIRHVPGHEADRKVKEMMEMVRLAGLGERQATQLSGGQQQRVALARALVFDPEVLLLDEPLSNLDTSLRDIVRLEVRKIQKSLGITTIYVTHDQSEALAISDEVVVMRAGKIMAHGTPKQVYSHPQNDFVASFVGRANLISGRVAKMTPGSLIVSTDVGEMTCPPPEGRSFALGDELVVSIRPENVAVAVERGMGPNWFRGKVEVTSFFGPSSETVVSLGEGGNARIRVLRASSDGIDFPEGSDVSVDLPVQHCSALPPGTALDFRRKIQLE
jgi:iron(III) transport system ATP-binding protein